MEFKEFKEFDFGKNRVYQTGELNHEYFYDENSINDKFRYFLNNKYNGKVECYIKPFGLFSPIGLFSPNGDNISSFTVQLLDHNNKYRKYINQVHINFSQVDEKSYVLGNLKGEYKVMGYSKKLSEQLFNDTIEFLDNLFSWEF